MALSASERAVDVTPPEIIDEISDMVIDDRSVKVHEIDNLWASHIIKY